MWLGAFMFFGIIIIYSLAKMCQITTDIAEKSERRNNIPNGKERRQK